ncbi:hypothetical protein ACSBR1_007430 [Camellia fascicularis]
MKSSRLLSFNSTPISSLPSVPASLHWFTRAWFVILRISTSFSMTLRSCTYCIGLSSPRPWSRSRWHSRRLSSPRPWSRNRCQMNLSLSFSQSLTL